MHTHTHTHVYKRIDVQIHTHMHVYTYHHVRTHTHIHIYTHTHTKCTYERTQSTSETTARQRLRGQPNSTPRSSALLPVRITTARRPDHIRLSALVRIRSTQFIIHASSQLGHAGPWPPETRSFFCHFGGVFQDSAGWRRTERMVRKIVRTSRDSEKRKVKNHITRITAKQNALQGQRYRRRTYMHTYMSTLIDD